MQYFSQYIHFFVYIEDVFYMNVHEEGAIFNINTIASAIYIFMTGREKTNLIETGYLIR